MGWRAGEESGGHLKGECDVEEESAFQGAHGDVSAVVGDLDGGGHFSGGHLLHARQLGRKHVHSSTRSTRTPNTTSTRISTRTGSTPSTPGTICSSTRSITTSAPQIAGRRVRR